MNELELDALEFTILYLFETRRPDIPSLFMRLRNETECYMTEVMFNERIKDFNTARNNMVQDDVLVYLHTTLKELVKYKTWLAPSQVKIIESYFSLIDYYMTEMQKHGDISGV